MRKCYTGGEALAVIEQVTAFPFVFYLAVCTASFIFGVFCFFAGGLMRSAYIKLRARRWLFMR